MLKEKESENNVVERYVVSSRKFDENYTKIHSIEVNSDGTILNVLTLKGNNGNLMCCRDEISKEDLEAIKKNIIFNND